MLDPCYLLRGVSKVVVSILSQSLLVSLDGLFQLLTELANPLLLELKLLRLQCLFSLEFDFPCGEFIKGILLFSPHSFELIIYVILLLS
jgi:hypothetical protein